MRPVMVLAVWATLTTMLWALAYAWPPIGHMLIPIGAVVGAYLALMGIEAIAQKTQHRRAVMRWRRQREAFLAARARHERAAGDARHT